MKTIFYFAIFNFDNNKKSNNNQVNPPDEYREKWHYEPKRGTNILYICQVIRVTKVIIKKIITYSQAKTKFSIF